MNAAPAVALVQPAHADIIIQETHKFVIPSSAHVLAQGRTATNLWGVPDTAGTCALVQLSFVPGQQLFYYGARTWPAGVRKSMYDQFGGLPKDLEMEHDYDPKVTFVCMRERVALGLLVHFAASRRAQLWTQQTPACTARPVADSLPTKVLDMADSAQYWKPGSLDSPYYGSTGF